MVVELTLKRHLTRGAARRRQVEVHDQKFWTAKLPGSVTDRFHHMGTARVALKDIRYSPTWVPLLDKSGKPVGELELSRVVDGAVNHETHQYRKFYSKAANVLQGKLGSAYIVQEVCTHLPNLDGSASLGAKPGCPSSQTHAWPASCMARGPAMHMLGGCRGAPGRLV